MSTNEERIAKLEADSKTIFHQLTELQKDVRSLRDLTVSVREMAVTLSAVKDGQEEIRDRLRSLESVPGEDARYYKRTAFSCIITGVLSALVGAAIAAIFTIL